MPIHPARLLLVRHAESEDNVLGRLSGWTDAPLTPRGLAQAKRVAALLGVVPIDAIYTSPLARARRTADAIAAGRRLVPVDQAALREWSFGACEGLTAEEIERRRPDLALRSHDLLDSSFGWPEGETRAALYERGWRAIEAIAGQHAGGTVAVVSHNGLLSTYLARLLRGVPWAWPDYVLDNGAFSEVLLTPGGIYLARHNVGGAPVPLGA